jgi:hypothetical protein
MPNSGSTIKRTIHIAFMMFASQFDGVQNHTCGAGLVADIAAGSLAGLSECLGVGSKTVHETTEVVIAADLEAAVTALQLLSLLETLVVGTEDDRHAPYGSLDRVVYAYAEASAYIGDGGVAIDAGEKTEAVDDEGRPYTARVRIEGMVPLPCRDGPGEDLCITPDVPAHELLLNLLQVALVDDVRGDDELPVGMLAEIADKDIFVGLS